MCANALNLAKCKLIVNFVRVLCLQIPDSCLRTTNSIKRGGSMVSSCSVILVYPLRVEPAVVASTGFFQRERDIWCPHFSPNTFLNPLLSTQQAGESRAPATRVFLVHGFVEGIEGSR